MGAIFALFSSWWVWVLLIPISAIVFDGLKSLYRMRLRHIENLERIRMGYPTIDDYSSKGHGHKGMDVIDMTEDNSGYNNGSNTNNQNRM